MQIKIIDFPLNDQKYVNQAAKMLLNGFKKHWSNAWPDMEAALKEVRNSFTSDTINRLAINEKGEALGWVGAISQYNGNSWELHPLIVQVNQQRKGIGRALVQDIEAQVLKRGGITIYLGTDDEDNMTSLGNVDLYPNVFEHLKNITNLKGHPFEFYQRLGYVIVGVIPDANGQGKPDILMAKRLKQ